MDALPEAERVRDVALDVEAVGIGILALVAIRRRDQEQDAGALGYALAVPLDVARDDAAGTATARCSAAPPRPRRGCTPGRRDLARTPPGGARTACAALASSLVVVSLPAPPISEQKPTISPSVRRVLPPSSVSISASNSAQMRPSFGRGAAPARAGTSSASRSSSPRGRAAGASAVSGSRSSATSVHSRSCLRSASGTPSSVKITSIGSGVEKLLHEVAAAARDERLEQADRGLAHERLELGHAARREDPTHQLRAAGRAAADRGRSSSASSRGASGRCARG